MRRRRAVVALFAVLALVLTAAPALGTFPFPTGSGGGTGAGVYDYTRLHINNGSCPPGPGSDLPKGFDCKNSFKLTDYAPQPGDQDYDPTVENNPQELFGVKGPGTNHAWELTTGRPDTLITVMDSGIEWNTPELANKVHLNLGELPVPCTSPTCTTTRGSTLQDYDVNHDGVFNVQDYAHDPRVTDANHNGILDPEDLILAFSDGNDDDHNGYVDDVAGWDFYQADNDPAALNHTMVVNSVTPAATAGDIPGLGSALPDQVQSIPVQHPATFLAFNGCTNFGGYTWVSIESSSCSSDATGQSSGMAGLL